MKIKLKNLAKTVFGSALVSLMLVTAPVYAFDGAILSDIKISSKDNYSYKIILKTNKDVPVEKHVTADNKIVIDLKNTKSAEFVNTIYNNTPEIDNVIVQAVPGDKVRIFIQGLNISSSKIILDSRNEVLDFMVDSTVPASAGTNNISAPKPEPAAPVQVSQAAKENVKTPVINLAENTSSNPSMEEPVKMQYSDNSLQSTNNSFVAEESNNIETVKNSMLGSASLKKIFSKEGFDWLLRIFAVIFIVIGAFKLFGKPKDVTIDLSSENMKSREMEFFKTAKEKRELASKSLGSNYTKERIFRNPAYGANSQYGLREYQNSQLPPKKLTRPAENINADLNRAAKLNEALRAAKSISETRTPAVKPSRAVNKDVKTAKANMDNVQFLESMAAIYQKSGRADLAQNIRQSLKRTQAAG